MATQAIYRKKRLLEKNRCEVLIIVMVDSMNRWLTHPAERIRAHITETFGTYEAVKIALGGWRPSDSTQRPVPAPILAGGAVRPVLRHGDHDNRTVYYLFFASNNPVGHLKMKEAMWNVDPLGDFSFSDSTDPKQPMLFDLDPSVAPLAADLANRFRGSGPVRVKKVETYVQDDTPNLRKHMGEALKQTESS